MAVESTIGGGGAVFVGEDKELRLGPLYDANAPTVGVNMAGWTMVFDVRAKDTSSDPPLVSITPLTLMGTFNALQASNTQQAVVPLTDDLLNLFKAKSYRWSWKRTDPGNEAVLGWGTFAPQKATAP